MLFIDGIHSVRSYSTTKNNLNDNLLSSNLEKDEDKINEEDNDIISIKDVTIDINNVLDIKLLLTPYVKFYKNAHEERINIIKDYKDVSGIYLWHNNITGEQYVGSGIRLSKRLATYYYPSRLAGSLRIYKSILEHGHNNFSLVVLETFPIPEEISNKNKYVMSREQHYMDIYLPKLNSSKFAHSSKGYKHTEESKKLISKLRLGKTTSLETRQFLSKMFSKEKNPFYGKNHSKDTINKMKEKKIGANNPMFGKPKSPEFIYWATRDRKGANNPMFGKPKSIETLNKVRKPVYYFDAESKLLLGKYDGFIVASEKTGIAKTTLKRYMDNNKVYKGILFSYKSKLD